MAARVKRLVSVFAGATIVCAAAGMYLLLRSETGGTSVLLGAGAVLAFATAVLRFDRRRVRLTATALAAWCALALMLAVWAFTLPAKFPDPSWSVTGLAVGALGGTLLRFLSFQGAQQALLDAALGAVAGLTAAWALYPLVA